MTKFRIYLLAGLWVAIMAGLIATAAHWEGERLHSPASPKYKAPEKVQLPPSFVEKVSGAPVKLHIGSHHYAVPVDYIGGPTPTVGGSFDLYLAWPSMVSYHEASIKAKQTQDKNFQWVADSIEIRLSPVTQPDMFRDGFRAFELPRPPSEYPIETLDNLGLYVQRTKGPHYYWTMDDAIRTPLQKELYEFDCLTDMCHTLFILNPEVSVRIRFNYRHLKDWKAIYYRSLELIKSIETPPPEILPSKMEIGQNPQRRDKEKE